jgi:GntR family transcriptional repressor for pyruvate dehydrogenase complex
MLVPIPPREGAAKACAGALRASILRGEMAVGSRLPPERSLAATLGVNRATVRAALRELEASGLVTARQGSGYAVHDYRASCGPDLLGPLAELARERGDLEGVVDDLLLVRRHLARAVLLRLDGRRLPRAAAVRIAALVDDLEVLAKKTELDVEAFTRADLAVLAALLDATQSPVLRLFFNPAAQALARIPELSRALYARPLENVAAWRALLAGVEVGEIDVDLVLEALARRDAETVARLKRAQRSPAR